MIRRVLVADDEPADRELMTEVLLAADGGLQAQAASDGQEACRMLDEEDYDAVFTDLRMPGRGGMEVLHAAREAPGQTDVVIVTGHGEVPTAVRAMKEGCFDFLLKPITVDQVEVLLQRLREHRRLVEENAYLRSDFELDDDTHDIVGRSEAFRRACARAVRVSSTDATVLVEGESGTGKELIARLIHECSPRREGSFVRVNCAALSETLLESELFGHTRGAFTGADRARPGRFEIADGGTLLLDEITETSAKLQAELLRVIEAREFQRVGGNRTITVDTRIIATTNRDLAAEVARGGFREDLYYRLNVVPIELPPLRERPGDVELLSHYFAGLTARNLGKDRPTITDEAVEKFRRYPWPGNVRELQNLMQRLLIMDDDGIIDAVDLPDYLECNGVTADADKRWGPTLEDVERQAILRALRQTGGNRTRAAERLDISTRTVRNKLKKYAAEGVLPEEFSGD